MSESPWVVMVVSALAMDPGTRSPFVLLKDKEGKRSLPIWIGPFEAGAIASQIEGVRLPRPMTHDLFKSMMLELGGKLIWSEIADLKEGTYYANLLIEKESGTRLRVDSRPSDAIAIALRVGAPIVVAQELFEKLKTEEVRTPGTPVGSASTERNWEEVLKNLSPDAFGKYKQ